ncbi:hypothetical protein [Rubrivirga sp. IMCC43871]|uniref:hypothetical protein n=1 Tax=Rubrivirga sp. IMCC43871 TaxID=3391575 RepID=UPI00398FE783
MPAHRWIVLLLVALAAPASAQMLPSGTWTGEMVRADGDRQPVEAALERCTGGFTLVIDIAGRTAEVPPDAPATWRRGTLAFETGRVRLPGGVWPRPLACVLTADDDGALAGTCQWGGERVRLRLAPPADAAFGCE